jgi:two-component system, LytTR family, response regulator
LTFATVNGHDHVVDQTLNELEARLDARRFVRIHRATLVNIAFVQELFPGVDALRPFKGLRVGSSEVERQQAQGAPSESRGGVLVRLKDEKKTELSVARDRVRDLKERLGI